ncbi:methyl-CpG-binding domain protein 5 isoform X2 [Bradysia coprophila]|uniref:methyl-CpG-binding domain protein 5 isoform X2 n=1 Tax=Bradysia coprophila TaxID=38358 RepID=UPI00187DB30A|nr:methyl-CpG-binding domain protein 5 isoform X2 [Bradysia coprophila]
MAAASSGTLQIQGSVPSISQSHLHQQQQQSFQQRLSYVQRSGSQLNVVSGCGPVTVSAIQQRGPNVAPGWRRQVNNGEIIYISPSGAVLRNLGQIKEYLLSAGTCKCGLPCPLRPDYFFEFNSQVPNVKLQIPLEDAGTIRTTSCLHQARLLGSNNLLPKDTSPSKKRKLDGAWSPASSISSSDSTRSSQTTALCNYVGSPIPNQMVIANPRVQPTIIQKRQVVGIPAQQHLPQQQSQTVVYQNQNVGENKVANVTVSRTPPWRKNSIVSQHQVDQQQTTQQIITNSNGRVPPLPQQHMVQQSSQPQLQQQQQQQQQQPQQQQTAPWQEETLKRRPIPKKRPNFKEDPTGYLDHQTAILHSSILNVHSPDIAENSNQSTISNSNVSYQSEPKLSNQLNVSTPNNDSVQPHTIGSEQSLSVMQQHQHNQNVFIQQQQQQSGVESAGGKTQPHVIIGSNGQPIRILQNGQIIYSNPTMQSVKVQDTQNNASTGIVSSGPRIISDEIIQPVQTTNVHQQVFQQQNAPRMMAPQQIIPQGQMEPVQIQHNRQVLQQQPQQQASSGQTQIITVQQHVPTSQPFAMNQSVRQPHPQSIVQQQAVNRSHQDHRIIMPSSNQTDSNQSMELSIGGQTVTHLPNGMVQVQQNCDIAHMKQQQQIQLQQQIQQQNMLFRQQQELQQNPRLKDQYQTCNSTQDTIRQQHQVSTRTVATSQESPVSSSTTYRNKIIEKRSSSKGPAQVGAISTSNESPPATSSCSSPADSPESLQARTVTSAAALCPPKIQTGGIVRSQTTGKNTITSVLAGKAMTSTTTTNHGFGKQSGNANEKDTAPNTFDRQIVHVSSSQMVQIPSSVHQAKISTAGSNQNRPIASMIQNCVPVSAALTNLQLQPICRGEPGSQIIMTSSGQILVMPPQSKSSNNQMIISGGNGSSLVMNNSPQGVVINQQGQQILSGDMIHGINNQVLDGQSANILQNSGNQVVIQGQNLMSGNGNRVIGSNNSNFIVNSTNNMQPMIINNSNIISHNGNVLQQGQNVIHGNQGNLISGTKVISSNGNILNGSNIISNQSNVLASNNQIIGNSNSTNLISPNGTVVLPNGYVLQPHQFTTVDGQVVNVINQDNGTHQFIQSTQQRIILSPDSKRRAKKRKSSSGTPPTPHSLSPQQSPTIQQHSPTIVQQNQSGAMLQITPQYQQQSFQISPGMSGITLVQNKPQTNSGPQQQILLQNGQTIIQPLNIIGQQLLVPAGLMVAPDTTLLQIQNVGPCGSILTPQGMMIRASSPQNKNFLSPNSGGQQFIVSGNGQISPIGQMYSTPMGLVVPQTNSNNSGPTYVQQNTTILQQQTTMINSANGNGGSSNVDADIRSQNQQSMSQSQQQQHHHHRTVSVSPPDTTTHSPRSPERPPSQRSNGSDTNMVQCVSSSEPDAVSPVADSARSPSNNSDYERSGGISYQQNTFKPSDAKIRRIQTPTQLSNSHVITQGNQSKMRPDSHVWGAARGHPAWPGKIVSPPETYKGVATSSDSTWVQWFGGRPNVELVSINSLKSLSEGLEAHHKAQKDTRKSRKLNSQLECAIQEAMAELDRTVTATSSTPTTPSNRNKARTLKPTSTQQRTKPVKIAPAPPNSTTHLPAKYLRQSK